MAIKAKSKTSTKLETKALKQKGKVVAKHSRQKPAPVKPGVAARAGRIPSPKAPAVRANRKPDASVPSDAGRAAPPRLPSKQFAVAVAALEAGIKSMYAEDYDKAIRSFNRVLVDHPEEPELQASAKARIQACEKKLLERSRAVYRSADDHYNVGIALLNRGELEPALVHLQQALKLAPKSDHILYAIAAANALQGNKDQALMYLKQSIHHRPENRFQAVQDRDFAALIEEPAFKELLTSAEK